MGADDATASVIVALAAHQPERFSLVPWLVTSLGLAAFVAAIFALLWFLEKVR